jgi:hypothetical protein
MSIAQLQYPNSEVLYCNSISNSTGLIGNGATGPAGENAVIEFADFYALMPSDNPSAIAVGANVLFPESGASYGQITRLTSSTFNLHNIGTYKITCQCSISEAGQLAVSLNSSQLAYSVSGRATLTSQIIITCLVQTSSLNNIISIINANGNSTALTLTSNAGGTNAVSAHLLIERIL